MTGFSCDATPCPRICGVHQLVYVAYPAAKLSTGSSFIEGKRITRGL